MAEQAVGEAECVADGEQTGQWLAGRRIGSRFAHVQCCAHGGAGQGCVRGGLLDGDRGVRGALRSLLERSRYAEDGDEPMMRLPDDVAAESFDAVDDGTLPTAGGRPRIIMDDTGDEALSGTRLTDEEHGWNPRIADRVERSEAKNLPPQGDDGSGVAEQGLGRLLTGGHLDF